MNMRPFFVSLVATLAVGVFVCRSPAAAPANGRYPLTDQARAEMLAARDRVFPALVFIKVVQQTHERGEKSARETAGSGVLISADGEFLTNWHVVDKAAGLRCLLTDGRAFAAELVGSDKDTDLALGRLTLPPGTTALLALSPAMSHAAETAEPAVSAASQLAWLQRLAPARVKVAYMLRYHKGDSPEVPGLITHVDDQPVADTEVFQKQTADKDEFRLTVRRMNRERIVPLKLKP